MPPQIPVFANLEESGFVKEETSGPPICQGGSQEGGTQKQTEGAAT